MLTLILQRCYHSRTISLLCFFLIVSCLFHHAVQNGSMHQKDAVNDDDFEPYLSNQTNQVGLFILSVTFSKQRSLFSVVVPAACCGVYIHH